jgi:hypothetical protein
MNETQTTNNGSNGSRDSGANIPLDSVTASKLHALPSLCRGLYSRVAQKLGCDPSYVSRVARGERTSETISDALRTEIQHTWTLANELTPAKPPKRKSATAASAR